MKLNLKLMAKSLRVLCAIALLSVGFAHKPMTAFAADHVQSLAYQLPDGTFAEICSEHDGDQHKGKMADFGCDACRLSASILVPMPPSEAGDILRVSSDVSVVERPESIRHRLYPPNSGPRAPPHVLMHV